MAKPFRVIDTGLRDGRRNIAFDQAMIALHKAGEIPDTIRFLRFPPTALIGRHQSLGREVRLDHCRRNGIGIARRITGGGAIYFDEGQLGWELVFGRRTLAVSNLADLTRMICEAAALGMRRLGVDAQFRPRNDIEVAGRKLSGTGGFFDGDTLFYQGTLLIDSDMDAMVAALKVPEAKLKKRDLDTARQRVVTLRELLGADLPPPEAVKAALVDGFARGLGIDPRPGSVTRREEAEGRRRHDEEIGTEAFVAEIDEAAVGDGVLSASQSGPGGTLSAYLRLEGPGEGRVRELLLTGDFFVTPPKTIFDLEASLRGQPVAEVGGAVMRFFETAPVDLSTIAPEDVRRVIEAALATR